MGLEPWESFNSIGKGNEIGGLGAIRGEEE